MIVGRTVLRTLSSVGPTRLRVWDVWRVEEVLEVLVLLVDDDVVDDALELAEVEELVEVVLVVVEVADVEVEATLVVEDWVVEVDVEVDVGVDEVRMTDEEDTVAGSLPAAPTP